MTISILTFFPGFIISKKYEDAKSLNVADLKISHPVCPARTQKLFRQCFKKVILLHIDKLLILSLVTFIVQIQIISAIL